MEAALTELLQLHYFLELAKTEHVTKTAEKLHVSQPSLSITVKKLEEELKTPLFERKGRNIRLSKYGKAFASYVEEALFSIERGKRALADMKKEGENTVRLGVLSPYVWSDLFAAFKEKEPDIMVSRYSMEGGEYVDALLRGEIDAYLGAMNDTRRPRLSYTLLYTDAMVLEVSRDNPLSRRKRVDLRECGEEKFINLARDTDLQRFASSLCFEAGIDPTPVMEVNYTLRDRMVSLGYGVSLTTLTSAKKCEYPNVVYLELSYPKKRRVLGLVKPEGGREKEALGRFEEFAKEYYEKRR